MLQTRELLPLSVLNVPRSESDTGAMSLRVKDMRRAEWAQQALQSSLFSRWPDHSCAFATAVDNVAASPTAGAMRRLRGLRAGLPDALIGVITRTQSPSS
jgi:hypothetical protein